ncbi:MAG TPA: HD domain-containing phosphohydrolase [Planctomycetaceae bacterium]|nr:HD domain-containing phosphohydrolase [Planctomycetaceae bacterium]
MSLTAQTADNDAAARVLVVDDERPVRELIVRWLQAAGFACHGAASAEAAWDALASFHPDLVTLDVTMPGESGLELLRRVREGHPDVEAVMVTASTDTRTAIEALTQGACGYLVKPIARDELLFHVRRGLERRQLLLERRQYTQRLEDTVRAQTRTIRHAHEETIHRLVAASMYRDEETGAHIRRTGLFSEALAEAAGWTPEEVDHIRLAAPMHDVGKIGIPDAILRKPGKLTREEFEAMKRHTLIGARMLSGSESPMLQMAEEIALAHHEHWDGRGYPAGRCGTAIAEAARIVSVVDVYDALTHDRVYRPALSEAEALQILRDGRGTHFDPEVLDCFLDILPGIRRIAAEHPDEECIDGVEEMLNALLADARQPADRHACRPSEVAFTTLTQGRRA